MEGKEYLLNGDLKLLTENLKMSYTHVNQVLQGKRKSPYVENAIKGLIEIRKQEMAEMLESLKRKKEDELCLTNGMENLPLQNLN